jgi:uncharacterized repeat protein (TIGR03803 family)
MNRIPFTTKNRIFTLFVLVLTLAVSASAAWKEKVLYSFQGIPDGAFPGASVVFDSAGNLYGTTYNGGANSCPGILQCGVVFQLKPPLQRGKPWTETVLYVFKGANYNDGSSPVGGVLFDQAGNLYGTTAYGGSGDCKLFGGRSGCGTVFELVPPKQKGGGWKERVLYSFKGGKDGYFPWGNLTFDSAGNLYGATQYGGGFGSCNAPYYQYCGTVFKLSAPETNGGGKWTEQLLYAFKSGTDGANPNGGLIFDSKGTLYGTTFYGANQGCGTDAGVGCGTVFTLKPTSKQGRAWTEEILLRFKADASMGGNPAAGLIFDPNGDLYGTTSYGGQIPTQDVGTVFRLSRGNGDSWHEALLYSFSFSNGGYEPLAALVFDSTGSLFGAAPYGGNGFTGVIFKLHPPTGQGKAWAYNVLYSFGKYPDGTLPESGLIFDRFGNLYGTTLNGGAGDQCQGHCGTVFELQP